MGEIDLQLYNFISNKERFADLFNGCFFAGKNLIKAADLSDASEKYVTYNKKTDKFQERIHDIKKYHTSGISFQILAVENQTYVDYTLPFRHMDYDTAEYHKQIKELKIKNRKTKKEKNKKIPIQKEYQNAEWLCGLKQTDKLVPIFSIYLYLGEAPWNGARTLKEMMNFHGQTELEKWFNDYPINLVCANELTNFHIFHTDLKEFFEILSCRKDMNKMYHLIKENPIYQKLSADTARLLTKLTGISEKIPCLLEEKGETINMCKAINDIWLDGEKTGKNQGNAACLVKSINSLMKNFNLNLEAACTGIGVTVEEYQAAQTMIK